MPAFEARVVNIPERRKRLFRDHLIAAGNAWFHPRCCAKGRGPSAGPGGIPASCRS